MIEITVEHDTLIGDIQKEFNIKYPYLMLEFFKPNHSATSEEKIGPAVTIGRLWNSDGIQILNIKGDRTINDLEKDFKKLKLCIRVLRKSGRSWIATSLTKDWTLEQQNHEGEMMSSINEKTPKNEVDWDIW